MEPKGSLLCSLTIDIIALCLSILWQVLEVLEQIHENKHFCYLLFLSLTFSLA